MKRNLKNISNLFFAAAAIFAFIFGLNLTSIQTLGDNIIENTFPVRYDIDFANGSTISDAVVKFNGDTAVIYANNAKKTVSLNDAVFTCVDKETQQRNIVRGGLMSLLLFSLSSMFVLSLIWLGFEVRFAAAAAASKARTRKMAAANIAIARRSAVPVAAASAA